MKKRIPNIITSILTAITLGIASLAAVPQVSALDVFKGGCDGATSGSSTSSSATAICGATTDDKEKVPDLMKTIINTILLVLGMIAVIMIVIGGIRYTTSNGDASNVKAAKDTILYAVVGLVVAILSFAIVNFVLGRFS